ncbi:hypothetical protein [Reinekea sp. G2M2-21]|uniref:hypothetical protein n=1 Tax=Reinekea sp. G2M2-21 TaxID=2788942 RepID=UPI0018A9566C|nr:hypothetical protein [Reinekea sp. G2M2-21]
MKSTSLLLAILFSSSMLFAQEGCIFNGQQFAIGASIGFLSADYTAINPISGRTPESEGHSEDGYTFVIKCAPVVNPALFEKSQILLEDIPFEFATWTLESAPDDLRGMSF